MTLKTVLASGSTLFAAFAIEAVSSPVGATVVTITYNGTVGANSYDVPGIFGVPDADLGGLPYKLVFVVNTAAGETDEAPNQAIEILGGAQLQESSPVTAYLTIEGKRVEFSGGVHAGADPGPNGDVSFSLDSIQLKNGGVVVNEYQQFVYEQYATPGYQNGYDINNYVYASIFAPASNPWVVDPTTLTTPYTFSSFGSGANDYSVSSAFDFYDYSDSQGVYGSLIATSATVAVPEPAAWALMLVGFSSLGAALRSGRRRTALAAG